MLPLIKRELVGAGLLEEEEFIEIVSLAQSLPGAVAINTASLVGWRLRGWRGELVAIGGTALPSFLSIVVVSFFLLRFGDLPSVRNFFQGAIPLVAALILLAVWDLGRKIVTDLEEMFIVVLLVFLLRFFHLHPLWIMCLGGVWGVVRKR